MHALRTHTFIQAAAIRSDDTSRLQHHQYEAVSQYRLNREILAQHIKKKKIRYKFESASHVQHQNVGL